MQSPRTQKVNSFGVELLLDLFNCQFSCLTSVQALEEVLIDAVELAGFDIVKQASHRFPEQGITLIIILSQSHIALHTWPEERYVSIDLHLCGAPEILSESIYIIQKHLIKIFEAKTFRSQVLTRGLDKNEVRQ